MNKPIYKYEWNANISSGRPNIEPECLSQSCPLDVRVYGSSIQFINLPTYGITFSPIVDSTNIAFINKLGFGIKFPQYDYVIGENKGHVTIPAMNFNDHEEVEFYIDIPGDIHASGILRGYITLQ
jgi:hypothetical protein